MPKQRPSVKRLRRRRIKRQKKVWMFVMGGYYDFYTGKFLGKRSEDLPTKYKLAE